MSPRRQERLFEKHYSKTLHNIAEGDFRTAQAIAGLSNIRIENVFYLAQQAIEKALKAVLVAKEIPVPMIHDLAALVGKLPTDCDPPYGYELNELSQFATIRRYEEGSWTPTAEELQTVLKQCKDMLDWAKKNIE
ncbi:MAG: HEPN domain-containing protein [Oligoflexus sp.]